MVESREGNGDGMSSKSSGQIIIQEHGPTESVRPSTTGSLDLSSPLSPVITQMNPKYKVNALFSVASIKRKRKNAMGREQSGLSPEGVGEAEIPHTTDGAAKGSGNANVDSYVSLSEDRNESCAIGYDESSESPFISPSSWLLHFSVELRIQPMQIRFEDQIPETLSDTQAKEGLDGNSLVLEYVKAVLRAPRFNWSEHYLRLKHSDQLIDPSLFDGVDFSIDHCQHDRKLVFDCINEVLLDVFNDLFRCCPWVTFVQPGIRHLLNRESPVIELCKGIRWHLLPLPVPRTLDHIVRKDLAKCGNWMDMHCDCESIGFNMGEAIFEGLIEETLLISLGFADVTKTEGIN
ncbi:hypothetical protein MLD38_010588 [Melastoma candidum]|uniref:Uncharacterized protein n=1 Tax=Melastoma candidum TaxID=119954 RepID=A0ACB9QZS7_9MYRT|nr:hypothetical protein MLD38_010588 [Melastoma candidum]